MEKLEDDKARIKTIFSELDNLGKDEVRSKISSKYHITVDTAKNHWIYGGNIPQKSVAGVLKIVKTVATKKMKRIETLIA